MKKHLIILVLLCASLFSYADGCSGAATFTYSYDPIINCYTFTNTTNNDCSTAGICTWDFGDGSPVVTTIQGAQTICHQFPDCDLYTISLTYDANSCFAGAICYGSYQINITTFIPDYFDVSKSDYNGYNVSCLGDTNGWIQIDSLPPLCDVYWANGDSGLFTGNLSAGIHNATIIDDQGCNYIFIDTLVEPTPIITSTVLSNYNGYNVSCFNGDDGLIDLSVTGSVSPYSYQWNNGDTTEDIDTLIANNSYHIIVTDLNNCTITDSVILIEPPDFSLSYILPNYNNYNVSCFGATDGFIDLTTIGSVPPYSFSWSNGGASEDLSNIPSNVYFLTITDQNQCQENFSVSLSQPTQIVANAVTTSNYNGYNVSCNGFTDGAIDLTVNGSVPPYSFLWSNGASTEDLANIGLGTYTVNIIDNNGCLQTASASVIEPNVINTSIVATSNYNGYNISCNGMSNGTIDLTVNGSVPPYTYMWSNGEVIQDISNVSAGLYTVDVTDNNGCITTNNITLTEPTILTSSISAISNYNGYNISCFNLSDGVIDLTVGGSVPPYNYQWNNGATTQDISGIAAGMYLVNITDNNNCNGTENIVLTQPTQLVSNAVITSNYNGYNISCNGYNDGAIDLTVNGSVPPYIYQWSNGITSEDQNNIAAGNYNVSITDANLCTSSNSLLLTEPTPLVASISPTTDFNGYNISCFGFSDGGADLMVSGSVPPYFYSWNNGFNTEDLSNVSAGGYSANITDNNNCQSQANITLSEPTDLISTIAWANDFNGYAISCFGFSDGGIDLTVNGSVPPYIYQWNNGANSQDIYNLTATTYNVNITDDNNCTNSESIVLTQPDSLHFVLDYSKDTCSRAVANAEIIPYGGVQPYAYLWSNNMTTSTITNLGQGNNTTWLTDANNCQKTESFFVGNLPSPTADYNILPETQRFLYQVDKPILFIDNSTDEWTTIIDWFWDFGDGSGANTQNTEHSFMQLEDFDVQLIIENRFGCKDTIIKRIIIEDFLLYIPNSFTPQSDGINDEFSPKGIGVKDYELKIYSRWGEHFFTSTDLNIGWDGTTDRKNNIVQMGIYLYVINVTDIFGQQHSYNGLVKLIK